ncbi:MAG: glycosyltransferase family 2 protein [Sedimentisphaerales bacterium]|jgi:glycosyltransferase involved in cell wall biosynthesis
MTKVSIIVPTFNRSKLLKECVDSLLAQTYPDIEIIVVDDGSADDTQATIKEIAQKRNNVRYYSRPHLGGSAARNFGLTKATGEFIGFFDSDDLWPPNYVETMVKSLQVNPDFDAAYSKIMLLVDGKIQGPYITMEKYPTGYITTDLFFRDRPFNLPSSTILRKSTFNGVFWDEKMENCDDFDLFLRISTKSKFMYVPDVYMMYRQTEDSMTATAKKRLFTYHMYVMERFYFHLGGNMYVPRKLAMHKISHLYRNLALKHYGAGNRKASIALLKKALYYLPLDLRLYVNLLRAFLLNPRNDKMPDWKMPPPLPVRPESVSKED